ncbi:MAG: SPOR domain-containing protein [Salinibacter sp.]
MHRRSPLILLALAAVLCACSGSSKTTGQAGPSPDPAPDPAEEKPSVAEYETFDPSAYEARPPERAVAVVHRVPERLLRGRADEGVRRTVEGFRVQVFSARDQQAAQEFRTKVRRWWGKRKDEAPKSVFGKDPPIVIKYSQPYYRVRIGAFAKREEAEEALAFVSKTYETAFIARGTVTVTN